jgi:hypothetical protein
MCSACRARTDSLGRSAERAEEDPATAHSPRLSIRVACSAQAQIDNGFSVELRAPPVEIAAAAEALQRVVEEREEVATLRQRGGTAG